jgi:hypothetical protein
LGSPDVARGRDAVRERARTLLAAFPDFSLERIELLVDEADLGPGYTAGEILAEAQRVVRWHYQWLVIHEFLVKTVGAELVDDVLENGPRHYRWRNNPYIPVEFSVAAYRFGHSQVRPSYRGNFGTSATDLSQQFFALIFDPAAVTPDDPDDLRGGRRKPRRFIDWQTFFDFGDGRVRQNKLIDTTLSTPLFDLLGQPEGEPVSLATRNLLRNLSMKVPSGQRVAKAMTLPPLAPADLDDLAPFHLHELVASRVAVRFARKRAVGQAVVRTGVNSLSESHLSRHAAAADSSRHRSRLSQRPTVRRPDSEAERAGFEPAMGREPHTRLAGECLQPLGHLSGGEGSV